MNPPSPPLDGGIEPFVALAALGVLGLIAYRVLRRIAGVLRRAAGGLPAAFLDTALFAFTPSDVLTWRGLLDGGILVLGRPGSGKSSSSSFQLLRAAAAFPQSGGLILAASAGDLATCRRIFARQPGRLIVFDESAGLRCNAADFILAAGGSTKDLLAAILNIAESVGRSGGQSSAGGEEGSFFTVGARRILENAIVVVKHATGHVSPSDLLAFVNAAAGSEAEFHSEEFKTTLHYRYLKAAYEKEKSETEAFDCELARAFFAKELPRMADRTRTSLLAVVFNILHVFNSGVNRLLFSTETNVSPAVMDRGQWVFANQPVSRCGVEGAFSLGVWKFLTEWHVMRRDPGRVNPPLVIHADEIHRILNSHDALFLGECRKFSGCMIACTQSKASLYAGMAGEAAEAQVDNLVNNYAHKVVHALGDVKSAEWASSLVGSAGQFSLSGSQGPPPDGFLAACLGQTGWSGGFSESVRPLVEPRHFMHGLRTGGPRNGYLCDAYVIKSGEPFAGNGQNFLKVAFSQR